MDVGGLPPLEGTVAVNLALILKFIPAYLFRAQEFAPVPRRIDAADDTFLFRQGPARGLGKIRFHDWRATYEKFAPGAQRRPLHRAGRGAGRVDSDRRTGRRPAAGHGFHARAR
jgi:hypothetical protein